MNKFQRLTLPILVLLVLAVSGSGQKGAEPKSVRQFIDAYNSRKLDAMLTVVADDVKWFSIAGEKFTTETSDKESLRRYLEADFKNCPTCHAEISQIRQTGNRVTMKETATWRTDQGLQSKEIFAVYEFSNGKIARIYYYGEPSKAPTYDESLAKRLGADELGMKTYVFVNLVRGKKEFDKAERDRLIAGHLANIERLAASGKLVLAGPFEDDNPIRGIYIFDVDTIEKAKALTETDPAVQAGVFEFEMRLWYGSAALKELDRIHKSIQKKSITGK